MCGLVGVAGNNTIKLAKVFRDLLLFDQVRGWDSTGVGLVHHGGKMEVDKVSGSPNELWFLSKEFDDKGIVKGYPRVMMGHNRAATVGKVNEDNAHPFNFGHITGAHNGTLRTYDELHGNELHEVDSKALFHNIEQNGIEHTWKNFTGAAAITYWDDQTETLALVRNKERPLYMCFVQNNSAMVWASEKWMIEAALAHNGLAPSPRDGEDIFLLKENFLHVFKPKYTSLSLEFTKELEAKKYNPPVVVHRSNVVPMKSGGSKNTMGGTAKGVFNFRWTQNKPKAGKDQIGREFKLQSSRILEGYDGRSPKYILAGHFLDCPADVIHLYPTTFKEWEAYADSLFEEDGKDTVYKLKRRPRYVDVVTKTIKPYIYCASPEIIEVVKGIDPLQYKEEAEQKQWIDALNKVTYNKALAEKDLRLAGEACGYCNKELTIDDSYEYDYYGTYCLCEDCAKNKDQFQWMNGV